MAASSYMSMQSSKQPLYPEELRKFLEEQPPLIVAQPVEDRASPYEAVHGARKCEGVTPMPSEFVLMHPRRVRSSGYFKQPDGGTAHYTGHRILTPEDEAGYRLSDPENGLHPDDLKAFRASIRGPVKPGRISRFLARLKFL